MQILELQKHLESWLNDGELVCECLHQPVTIEPVLNWGGFTKSSFRLRAASKQFHLKLASAADQPEMRRWHSASRLLQERRHAPEIISWLNVPGIGYGGLLFPHIEGTPWSPRQQPALASELFQWLPQLHEDRELAQQLGDEPQTRREHWDTRYRALFQEDLFIVRNHRPPFVSEQLLDWMEMESRKLIALPSDDAAFGEVSASPCHWDLHTNNLLIEASGDWWVLDWDSVAIGDETLDYATLFCAMGIERHGNWHDVISGPFTTAFAQRMDLHVRAITLDSLIDALADWIECRGTPWEQTVQQQKQEEHLRQLEIYKFHWS